MSCVDKNCGCSKDGSTVFWHDCDLGGSWVSLGVKVLDSSRVVRFRDLEGQDLQP